MRHIEESTCGVPLHPHVLRLCQPRKRSKSPGPSDLRLVVFVCCQIRDASNGIALDLDVGGEHLPSERCQSSKLHDEDFVLGYAGNQLG